MAKKSAAKTAKASPAATVVKPSSTTTASGTEIPVYRLDQGQSLPAQEPAGSKIK